MIPFEVSKFKGVNRIVDPAKLEPGELTTLQGAYLEHGAIESLNYPSGGTISEPYFIVNQTNYGLQTNDYDAEENQSIVYNSSLAFKVTLNSKMDDILSGMIQVKSYPGQIACRMQLFTDNAGIPQSNLVEDELTHWSTSEEETQKCWRGCSIKLKADRVGVYWVVFTFTGSYSGMFLYGHQNVSCDVYVNTGSWESWSSAYSGKSRPQFALIGSRVPEESLPSTNNIDVLKNSVAIDVPFSEASGLMTLTSGSVKIDQGNFRAYSLAVLETPYGKTLISQTDGWNHQLVTISAPWTNQLGGSSASVQCSVSTGITIFQHGNIVAVTAEGVPYCIPLTLSDEIRKRPSAGGTYYRSTPYSAAVFQNYIALSGGGNGQNTYDFDDPMMTPCYIKLGGDAGAGLPSDMYPTTFRFSAPGTPRYPELVTSFAEHLIFANSYEYPFRMWYGTAGTIDTFNAFENISDSEPLLCMVPHGSSELIFGTGSRIYRYAGSPRYATKSTIHAPGIKSGSLIVSAMDVLFILAKDGLWAYDGSMVPMTDAADIICVDEQKDLGFVGSAVTGAQIFAVPRYHAIGLLLLKWNTTSKKIDKELWFYDYKLKYWYQYYFRFGTSSDFKSIGVANVGRYSGNRAYVFDSLSTDWSGNNGVLFGNPGVFSPMLVETGWLDPNSQMDQKGFKTFTMKTSNVAGSLPITITVSFDNGAPDVVWQAELCGTAGKKYTKIEKLIGTTASKFKVSISRPSMPTMEQIKIHEFTMWYVDGKAK
jgi:hypothetical protein